MGKKFKCKSEAQKKAIRRSYAKRAEQAKIKATVFPDRFPFWARLKLDKNRTTLVIDEEPVLNKQTREMVEGYVHREATHSYRQDFEEIIPNPDKDDDKPMYLRQPRKLPKTMFKPHNKQMIVPKHLRERYDKNNKRE